MNKLFEVPVFGTTLPTVHSDAGWVKNVQNGCEGFFFCGPQQDTPCPSCTERSSTLDQANQNQLDSLCPRLIHSHGIKGRPFHVILWRSHFTFSSNHILGPYL